MSLYTSPEQHAANPPETWTVERIPYGTRARWCVVDKQGTQMGPTYETKREAEANLDSGWYVRHWEKEQRWYDGESIPGWKSYAECKAEQERNEAWQAARRAEKEKTA